nr:hypothetical protein [Bacillus cabrialesii]
MSVQEGLARVAYVYMPYTKYIDQFSQDELEEKSVERSIWNRNGYVANRGINECGNKKTMRLIKQHSRMRNSKN